MAASNVTLLTAQTRQAADNGEAEGEATAFLGLGANIGDREASISAALRALDETPKIQVTQVSSLYETAPVGMTRQPDFLNVVARICTHLIPDELLTTILHLENQMGRVRTERWGPRVIDIDVLLYGDRQISRPGLSVPHPRLSERAFVLVPLAEIAPRTRIPGLEQTAEKILHGLPQTGNIRRLGVVAWKQAQSAHVA